MSTQTLPLLWPCRAEELCDRLARREVLNPDTDEAFTPEECDGAIQSAVETINGREGWHLTSLDDDRTWWMLEDDVADALGIAYDEMVEMAP